MITRGKPACAIWNGKSARRRAKVVTRIAEGKSDETIVTADSVKELLGKARYGYRTELQDRTEIPGVATGLAWTPVGGDALFIEATKMNGGKGFQYTGQLGEVMQESAKIAYSFARSRAVQLGIDPAFYNEFDIHLHVPSGAVPKDGPSRRCDDGDGAGIAADRDAPPRATSP